MPTTVHEIKVHYGEEQARLLNELAVLSMGPLDVDIELSGGVKERLGPEAFSNLQAAEAEAFLQTDRERAREKYLELDMELRAAIEVRVEQVVEELRPKNAGFKDFVAAAQASPEALITAMDMALAAGDEDAALVAFQAARERDLEEVTSHAITINERWGELYVELQDAAADGDLDPGGKFDTLAPKQPTREAILSNFRQSDSNITGMMR